MPLLRPQPSAALSCGKEANKLGYFIADTAYLLALLLDLAALGLLLEWALHYLPGGGLNSLRKVLFQAVFLLLKWSDTYLPVKWGAFSSRGLIMAALLLLIVHYGIPYLVWVSYFLRG